MRITPARTYLTSQVPFLITFMIFTGSTARYLEPATPACAGSLSVTSFRLLVEPAKSGTPLPVQSVNIIQPGEKLRYEPLHLPPAIKDKAKIAVLLAPASSPSCGGSRPASKDEHKAQGKKDEGSRRDLTALEARPAKEATEWEVPVRASVLGVVFGPHGLDVKKVSSLVENNPELIPELTEYAEQTAKVGALVRTLSEYEQGPRPGADLNAALAGFSSQYNVSVPRLDGAAPSDQQAVQLLCAVLPSLQSYDPLTSSRTKAMQQSAGLAGSVAGLFFGTPVGLIAGGTGLFVNLRTMMFPDSDFRSAFTQPTGPNGLALCSKNEPEKSRTRIAYLWMMRVPDAAAPAASLAKTVYLPMGVKSTVPISCTTPADSKLLQRAREWKLVSDAHHADVPVKVEGEPSAISLEIDLTQAKLPAGDYRLAALWDWEPFQVAGSVELRPLGDFSKVKISPDSEDHLVQGSGPVKVQLTGADFEFVDKVAMAKAGEKAGPQISNLKSQVPFTLPKGKAQGEQATIEAEVDTSAWEAGSYLLVLTQINGATHGLPIIIHPPDPQLEDLPLRVNLGEPQQAVTLHGTRLERLARLTSAGAMWELGAAPPDAHDLKQRQATIKLLPAARQGELLSASVWVQEIRTPLEIPGVLRVAGPRPKIASLSKSFAREPDVRLREGEISAGVAASFALRAENLDPRPLVSLTCANGDLVKQPLALHPGDTTGVAQLDFAGEGELFLSLDPGVVGRSGCQLTATITTDSVGSSDPSVLGRIIRLPHLEKFTLTEEKLGGALYAGTLTGEDLQTIDKAGWDARTGFPVQGIPTALPGASAGGPEQTLRVGLPWPPPSPHAPIYIWLRGENEGRLTKLKY